MLVKAAKRGQDLRVDMPAIGPRTVVEAARAGLSGIAVGAGSTLLLDQQEALRQADGLGLFLVAIGPAVDGGGSPCLSGARSGSSPARNPAISSGRNSSAP